MHRLTGPKMTVITYPLLFFDLSLIMIFDLLVTAGLEHHCVCVILDFHITGCGHC